MIGEFIIGWMIGDAWANIRGMNATLQSNRYNPLYDIKSGNNDISNLLMVFSPEQMPKEDVIERYKDAVAKNEGYDKRAILIDIVSMNINQYLYHLDNKKMVTGINMNKELDMCIARIRRERPDLFKTKKD